MASARLSGGMRRAFRAPIWLYRCKLGWMLGHRFLLLIHTGRRTRRRRSTVLEVMEFRKATGEMVVMCAFGPSADWYRNIQAMPDFEVMSGSKRFRACYRRLDKEEAAQVIGNYERRNRFLGPVVRTVLSKLLGWRYDGSEDARRRAAAELPLVSFRPKSD